MTKRIVNTQRSIHAIHPLAAAVASCLMGSGLANAATYHVTNTQDAGAGSLRQAVQQANNHSGADVIVFDASVSGTVKLSSGPLELSDSVTISGPGPTVLSIDAGGASDIFVTSYESSVSPVELNISGLTLKNGTRAIFAGFVFQELNVTVEDSTISGSLETGIYVWSSYFQGATLKVRNSVFTENDGDGITVSADRGGGGTLAILDNLTISNNGDVGVNNKGGSVHISGSQIRDNRYGLLASSPWSYQGSWFGVKDSIIANNVKQGILLGDCCLKMENTTVRDNGGAGIFADSMFVDATIRSSTISGNGAGGVDLGFRENYLTIANSTISGNRKGFGVRFDNYWGGGSISDSTITGNELGGVEVDADENYVNGYGLELVNSIVAGNGAGTRPDLSGTATFSIHHSLIQKKGKVNIEVPFPGSNIFSQDPLLGPLQNNGGPTLTHALLDGSPAIDHGDDATCAVNDQRGVSRQQDGNTDGLLACDIGAAEYTAGNGVIGDLVWRDDDGDGVRDPGEPGLSGVAVNLWVDCDPGSVLTTVTDRNGAYRFEGLVDGNYQVAFVKPEGYRFSPVMAAGNFRIDSNADPDTGLGQCRPLGKGWKGRRHLALDAGLIPTTIVSSGSGAMGDFVWRDDDGDGYQDATEMGLPGVTVNLRVDCDPATVVSTTTDSYGAYRFEGLPVGSYQLEFVKPTGYSFSPLTQWVPYQTDSNANPTTGLDQCRKLRKGQIRMALDAGLVPN